MKLSRMSLCLGIFFSGLLTAGCGTLQAYTGERLTREETALIKVGFKFGGDRAEIVAVDGQALGSSNDKAEVLPGGHTVSARLIRSEQHATLISSIATLNLVAAAAHTYEVFGKYTGGGFFSPPTGFTIWVEDKESKQVVATAKEGF